MHKARYIIRKFTKVHKNLSFTYAEHSHKQNDHALKFVGCLGNYRTEMPEFILRCFSTYPWTSLAIFGWDTER